MLRKTAFVPHRSGALVSIRFIVTAANLARPVDFSIVPEKTTCATLNNMGNPFGIDNPQPGAPRGNVFSFGRAGG
jgi:hypothetical protein